MKKFIIKLLGLDKQIDSLNEGIKALIRECAILTRDSTDQRNRIKNLERQYGLMVKGMDNAAKLSVEQKKSIDKIFSMIHVGVDVHDNRYQSSWCVVCLKGKENDRDIVNFFEVRFEDYKHLKQMLKQFDIFEKRAIDLPFNGSKNFFL